jgi:ATP-dependent DNA helicase RecQ
MIAFLENRSVCRERMLLTYFDETAAADCGHCDICKEKMGKPDVAGITNSIISLVKQANNITIEALLTSYDRTESELILHILRDLIGENVLSLSPGRLLSINRK